MRRLVTPSLLTLGHWVSPLSRAALCGSFVAVTLASLGCSQSEPRQLLADGVEFAAKGDYASAGIQFRAALQADPGLHEARLAFGRVLIAQGQVDLGLVELERAAKAQPPVPGAVHEYAKALVASNNTKRAVQVLSELEPESSRDKAVVKAYLAAAWSLLGDQAKSAAALDAALKEDPAAPVVLMFSSKRAWTEGRAEDAERFIEAALAAAPTDPDAVHFKAHLLQARGDQGAAKRLWSDLVKASPAYAPAHEGLIAAHLRSAEPDAARRQLDVFRRVAPRHPGVRLADARVLIAEGELTRARDLVLGILATVPEHPELLAMAGYIEARVGSPVQSAAHYRRLLSAHPERQAARLDLAHVELRSGQYLDAAKTLRPLVTAARPSAAALALASEVEMRQGNFGQAEQLLRRATEASPDDARLQAARLVHRMRLGEVEEPLVQLEKIAANTRDTYADEALFAARVSLGEFASALKVLDQLDKKSPGSTRFLGLRARLYLQQRELTRARAAFEGAVQKDPRDFGFVAALAVIDQLEDKPEEAIRRVRAVVDREPGHSAALSLLAELQLRAGGTAEQSAALLRSAIEAAPFATEPRLRLIELALSRRLYKDALEHSRAALAALPNDERLLEVTGRAQFLSGNAEQAAATFRALVTLVPSSAAPLVQLARVYDAQGRRDQATATLQRAVELDPSNESVQRTYLQVLIDSKLTQQALAHARRLKQANPKDPLPYLLIAMVHERSRDPVAALAELRAGLSKSSSTLVAGRVFTLLIGSGQVDEAGAFAAQWMQRNPDDLRFEYLLAEYEITKGELQSAESRLRRVVARYPADALALNNLAALAVQARKPDALVFARRAVGIAPDRPDFLDTLASALSAQGRHQDALALQRRAVEAAPERPVLRLGIARVAVAAGDKELARKELTELKRLDPKFATSEAVRELESKL